MTQDGARAIWAIRAIRGFLSLPEFSQGSDPMV
jgi:hypothetical protein